MLLFASLLLLGVRKIFVSVFEKSGLLSSTVSTRVNITKTKTKTSSAKIISLTEIKIEMTGLKKKLHKNYNEQ